MFKKSVLFLTKEETESGVRLEVKVSKTFLNKLEKGASISVNGVCLTVVQFENDNVSFDVIPETLRVTNTRISIC